MTALIGCFHNRVVSFGPPLRYRRGQGLLGLPSRSSRLARCWTVRLTGFSSDAVAASSGRTGEPVVLVPAESGKLGSPGVWWFPRDKPLDGSSLFFIVWPFLFPLGLEV